MKNIFLKKIMGFLSILAITFPYIGVTAYAASTYSDLNLIYGANVIKVYSIEEAIDIIRKNQSLDEFIAIELDDAIDADELKLQLLRERGITLGSATIFVGGMVVGWIVDGVVILATGQSPGDWVAQSIAEFIRGARITIRFVINPNPLPVHSLTR